MDRRFFYPGELLQDTDLLQMEKNAMIGIGALAELVFGQTTVVGGFTCTALSNTAVAGSAFAVAISRGFLTSYAEVDPNAFGTLGTDTTRSIVKVGINLASTNVGITNAAPVTAGQSINYLISAQLTEVDTNAVVLPYVNASNPTTPWLGQGNSGTSQNIDRLQEVSFTVTAGTAAATGSQTTPITPTNYVPLFVVTVTNGQTAVAGGNISQSSAAPIVRTALQNVSAIPTAVQWTSPGTYTWTVPAGVTRVKGTVVPGGGGGGSAGVTTSSQASVGSGGNGGVALVQDLAVTPNTVMTIIVGAGGAANGGTGGSSAIQQPAGTNIMEVNGCLGGINGTAQTVPFVTYPRAAGDSEILGGFGFALSLTAQVGGAGAQGPFGAGGGVVGVGTAGQNALYYGAGGGGAAAGPSNGSVLSGGTGMNGFVQIEY